MPVAHGAEAPVPALQLQDDDQRSLELPRPAQRIVSLAPGATAMLFAAGAGQLVVGTSDYSNEPEAAKAIERVGDSQSFDLERILALHPDVVVVWSGGTFTATTGITGATTQTASPTGGDTGGAITAPGGTTTPAAPTAWWSTTC